MAQPWGGRVIGVLLVLSVLGTVGATISDLRLCADPECKEQISTAFTVIGYPSQDEHVLSFPVNAKVTVYSKEAGKNKDLWGVEIDGKRGYVPKRYLRENKVFVKDLKHIVATELGANISKETEEKEAEQVNVEQQLNQENAKQIPEEVAISPEDLEFQRLNSPAEVEKADEVPVKKIEGAEEIQDEEDGQKAKTESSVEHVSEELEDGGGESSAENISQNESKSDGDNNRDITEEGERSENVPEEEVKEEGQSEDVSEEVHEEESSETVEEEEGQDPAEDNNENNESTSESSKLKTEDQTISEKEPSLSENEHESGNMPSPTPTDYEVIDGTTIYYDDPLPTEEPGFKPDSPVHLDPSSVVSDEYSSIQTPPILSEGVTESSKIPSEVTEPTVSSQIDSTASDVPQSMSETVQNDIGSEATESVTEVFADQSSSVLDESKPDIDPTSSSWIGQAATSVNSWFGGEGESESENVKVNEEGSEDVDESKDVEESKEGIEKDSDSDVEEVFGGPKPESVIENVVTPMPEGEEESGGFFSSWFGNSEESKEESDSPPGEASFVESDKSEQTSDFKSEMLTDDGSSFESGTPVIEPTVTSTPPSGEHTHVDKFEYGVDDAAFRSQPVETSPDVTVEPIPQEFTEDFAPTEHVVTQSDVITDGEEDFNQNSESGSDPVNDSINVDGVGESVTSTETNSQPTVVPEVQNVESHQFVPPPVEDSTTETEGSPADLDDPPTSSEDEEDLGPSTARPLFAEPVPVEAENLAHLADGETASMEETKEESADEGSLTENFLKATHGLLPEGLAFGVEAEVADPHMSSGALIFLGIVVCTIVLIYVIHLIMVKMSREAPMLEALNKIDREKRIISEENKSLHEQICRARKELEDVASRLSTSGGDVNELNSELELVKSNYNSEKEQLEERIVQLEHELEEATTNGLEMHKMLSEMLTSQNEATAFQASVDHLQSMLDGQREKVETLTSDLALKSRLNEELHAELAASRERANKLDYQVEQLTHSLEELTGAKADTIQKLQEEANLVQELKKANESLTEQTGSYDSKVTALAQDLEDQRETINKLREALETKDSELQVSKECLKQLRLTSDDDHAAPDEEKLSALFDVIKVKAELQKVMSERNDLQEQLEDAEVAQKNLEQAMASIRSEVTGLKDHHDLAIKEKDEALSKLAVLSQYFEEKEAQLTKELESQEGMRLDAEGSAAAVAKKIQNYELEIASYKKIDSKRDYQRALDTFSLSDLSPTTENVPMSDEYKVERVRAKAELRRQKRCSESQTNPDTAHTQPAFIDSSYGSYLLHSSNISVASMSDTSHQPQIGTYTQESDEPTQTQSNAFDIYSQTHLPPSYTSPPTSLAVRPSDPTSTRVQSVTVTTTISHTGTPQPVSSANKPLPSNIAKAHSTAYTFALGSTSEMPCASLSESDSDLRESPASDDVKSRVAAMRSLYEAKQQALVSLDLPSQRRKILTSSQSMGGINLKSEMPLRAKVRGLECSAYDRSITWDRKTQLDSLRKELDDQEQSYKSQISSHEQKAHENWVQARAAERKHEEQRLENAQLKSRLALMQKEKEESQQSNIIKPTPKRNQQFTKLQTFWESLDRGASPVKYLESEQMDVTDLEGKTSTPVGPNDR